MHKIDSYFKGMYPGPPAFGDQPPTITGSADGTTRILKGDPEPVASYPVAVLKDGRGLLEDLAALHHTQWCRWMRGMFELLLDGTGKGRIISGGTLARWEGRMKTEFEDLPEEQKAGYYDGALEFVELLFGSRVAREVWEEIKEGANE